MDNSQKDLSDTADSSRFHYIHFLSKITEKFLNAFYYACSSAKADYMRFMGVTAALALKIVSQDLDTQPVFFGIDNTIVKKCSTKSKDISKIFDHATHNG